MPDPSPNPEDYLTAKQIAAAYGVSRDHVTLLVRQGKLKAIRPGHEYLILRSEWERYEQEKSPRGKPRGPRPKKKSRKRE